MILDYKNQFSRLQAVTVSAASTDVVDQGAAGQAVGEELWLVARVGTAFTSADSGATLTIALQTDTVENFASPTTLFTSSAYALTSLTANTTLFKVRVPVGGEQYLRGYYTASATMTAGTVDLFLTADPEVR